MASQDQNTGTTHVELQGGENSKKLFSKYDLWSKAMDEKKQSSSLFTVNDTQEFFELCEACRRGDLEVVKRYVQFKNIESINNFNCNC